MAVYARAVSKRDEIRKSGKELWSYGGNRKVCNYLSDTASSKRISFSKILSFAFLLSEVIMRQWFNKGNSRIDVDFKIKACHSTDTSLL